MADSVKIKGHVLVKKNGKVIHEGKNLIVDAGLALMASLLADAATVPPSHMAVGETGTTPAGGQTTLVTELYRVALSASTALANTITFNADFTGENSVAEIPREFGIFNDAIAGTMFCRFTCPAFDWFEDDTLQISWTLTFGAE